MTDNLDAIALDRTAYDLRWMRRWAEDGLATFTLRRRKWLDVEVRVFSARQFDRDILPLLDEGWRVVGVGR